MIVSSDTNEHFLEYALSQECTAKYDTAYKEGLAAELKVQAEEDIKRDKIDSESRALSLTFAKLATETMKN